MHAILQRFLVTLCGRTLGTHCDMGGGTIDLSISVGHRLHGPGLWLPALVLHFSQVLQLPYSNTSWLVQHAEFGDPLSISPKTEMERETPERERERERERESVCVYGRKEIDSTRYSDTADLPTTRSAPPIHPPTCRAAGHKGSDDAVCHQARHPVTSTPLQNTPFQLPLGCHCYLGVTSRC